MTKMEQMYEGKAKKVYATDDANLCIVSYKDDATAFNGEKKGTIRGKGVVNNRMANYLMVQLAEAGIPTHLVEELNDRETLVKRVTILPLEVIVRNIAAGSFSKRFGVKEGTVLAQSTLEFCLKDDSLGDPMVNNSHILACGWATQEDLDIVSDYTMRINDFLKNFFAGINITLVDFKIEFGKTVDGQIVLADEISPDTCRFWDSTTGQKLDKDRFRQDMGDVEGAYEEMMRRIFGEAK